MTKPNSHVKFWSMKKYKKILTCISLKRYLRGVGMNNYWNHEPEFFWYKKMSEKVRNFWLRGQTPPSSRFFEKISDVIFLRPLSKIVNFESFLNIFKRVTPIENSEFWVNFETTQVEMGTKILNPLNSWDWTTLMILNERNKLYNKQVFC